MPYFSKYHKGQKVIFTAKPFYNHMAQKDSGKTATVVKCFEGYYDIYIEDSENNRYTYSRKVTWCVREMDLKPARVKGEQLLFGFMMP